MTGMPLSLNERVTAKTISDAEWMSEVTRLGLDPDSLTQRGLASQGRQQLIQGAVRASAISRADQALILAREAATRHDLDEGDIDVVAFVIWCSDQRAEALELIWDVDERLYPYQDWEASIEQSFGKYIKAVDAPPAVVLELLLHPHPNGFASVSIPTVGSLTGRFAYMRMETYLELGDTEWASREALAAIKSNQLMAVSAEEMLLPYRNLDALPNPVALTAEELEEARKILKQTAFDHDVALKLFPWAGSFGFYKWGRQETTP